MGDSARYWIDCTAVNVIGLHRQHGVYAMAVGALKPVIWVDPLIRSLDGQTACIFHESCHVIWKHLFTSRLLFAFALVCPPILLAWIYFQRTIERDADDFALENVGEPEFRAFVYMHPHPKSRWGRWCYGASASERLERALLKKKRREAKCEPGQSP
jgi:hypothetical protein